ncbi:helix-turn-helix transcriptional regulator, partial [bacterium]|nr:helix-turn-helix transcriptional regulator [bacterium]
MDEQILKNFGLNFKIERIKLGLTQDAVSEMTDFSNPYISNVEKGK